MPGEPPMTPPRQIYASTLTRRDRVWTRHRRGRRARAITPSRLLGAIAAGGVAGALLTRLPL